ncbi:hypothetical protein HY572_05625 [Candidatus Micrarchaeota archaeon]|nr:hypothetical protein [Candidatus Micrarchaeota archaeon]
MIDADLKIREIIPETHDVKTLRLDLEGQNLDFQPGQFSSIQVDTPEGKQFRSFSIASSPLEKDHIDLTVKRYDDSSAAKALHALNVGNSIHVKAPFGKFVFSETDENVAMIAGGNGITALMSMIRYITGKKLPIKPALLFSIQTAQDFIFQKELEQLDRDGKIGLHVTLTREAPEGWNGLTGRCDAAMIRKAFGPLQEKTFFLCGPPEMVKSMHEILLGLGVHEENIRMEEFVRPKKKT